MEIVSNIYRFETGAFNWYIVRDQGRLTLVDAGFAGHYRVLVEGLRSLGHTIQDIAAVLLTHAHADHMGMAERVRAEAGATVFVHSNDSDSARRTLQLPWLGLLSNAWRPFVSSILAHAAVDGVFVSPAIQSVKSISHGDILDVPGAPRVIHVPGHTPGEVVFHFSSLQAAAMGDALVTLNLLSGRPCGPQLPNWQLNADHRLARSSLDRLLDLSDITILPGHGKPWTGAMVEIVQPSPPRLRTESVR